MADDPLRDARLRVKWAKKHIADADGLCRGYLVGKPNRYTIKKDIDPATGEQVEYLLLSEELPEDLLMASSYAVQNLRSALDHLAYALAHDFGCCTDLREVYFPIRRSKAIYEDPATQGKIAKQFSPKAIAFLDALKPYPGGNDAPLRSPRPRKHRQAQDAFRS